MCCSSNYVYNEYLFNIVNMSSSIFLKDELSQMSFKTPTKNVLYKTYAWRFKFYNKKRELFTLDLDFLQHLI